MAEKKIGLSAYPGAEQFGEIRRVGERRAEGREQQHVLLLVHNAIRRREPLQPDAQSPAGRLARANGRHR